MNFRHEVKYFEEHGELDPDAEYDRMREDREMEREMEQEIAEERKEREEQEAHDAQYEDCDRDAVNGYQ